ncbi:uncharacterized protein LOC116289512 [Actinia tenebrosa]|uniref:Uncharacterized protein LOC116289512 n=1 Tax=Actinia tenebrosa TaxID=6105 RepID=A0A6P8HB23_ACTTE|nr:uncharacterized protein LOC116289512 [Actinia tenebrosa]
MATSATTALAADVKHASDAASRRAAGDPSSSTRKGRSAAGKTKGRKGKSIAAAAATVASKKQASKWYSRYFEVGAQHPQALVGTSAFLSDPGDVSKGSRAKATRKKWLEAQTTHQIHRPARRNYPRRPFVVFSMDEQWQMDLSDMTWDKPANDGMGWILFVVDVLSRYCWVRPLKRKTGEETARGIREIFEEVAQDPDKKHTLPRTVYVDNGSEFYNKDVKDLFASCPLPPKLMSGESTTKAAIVERLQRTLKGRLWKYFYENGTRRWVDVIGPLTDSYNHQRHGTLKQSPASVHRGNEGEVWKKLYGEYGPERGARQKLKGPYKFNLGDVVRISRQTTIFDKGYLPQWSEEWFKIRARDPGPPAYYRLMDYDGEDILNGTFYEEELLKVEDEEIKHMRYRIEKILQRRTDPATGRPQVLVKYQGWPEKYANWIDERQVEDLGPKKKP